MRDKNCLNCIKKCKEKIITELEKENNRLILAHKSVSEKLMNITREKLDLQKENAELEKELKYAEENCLFKDCLKVERLEKENAELKAKNKWYSEQVFNKECAEVWGNLTKAKEILREYIRINLLPPIERNFNDEVKLFKQAEQFIKENK